ncbi:unnamed protein product [Penicillium pancosmium]
MSVSVLPRAETVTLAKEGWPLPAKEATAQPSIDQNLLERIRNLWAQVLHEDAETFSDQDVFFEVGGDSISALDLVMAAEKQGISLTMEQIFTFSSLEKMTQLASIIGFEKSTIGQDKLAPFQLLSLPTPVNDQIDAISQICGIDSQLIENAYPCSPMQQSLVAAAEGAENNYVRQLVYELRPDAQLKRFQGAWEDTVQSNPVLRSRIVLLEKEGYAQAVINGNLKWNTVVTRLDHFLETDANSPMRLGDPFFRYTIVTSNDTNFFVWTLHHALCDGASVLEVLEDVSRRFEGEVPIQRQPYDRFIQSISQLKSQQEEDFWRQMLDGIDAPAYPALPYTDFNSNPSSTVEAKVIVDRRPPFGLTKGLLLRAAWAIVLSHHTGTEDVSFGSIVNGRNSSTVPGVDRMSGPTISLLPIALTLDPQEPVQSFLGRVRNQATDIMSFEHTGIVNIRHYTAGRSTACDFRTLFLVHPASLEEASASSLHRLGLRDIPEKGKKEEHPYPLVISVMLSGLSVVTMKIQFDERVLSHQYAQNLGNQFQAVVTQLSRATKDTLLGSISPLNERDLSQIRNWNRFTPPPEDICFHDLFKNQVCRTPHAEAICSIDRSLSYAELDNISSVISTRLISLGVQPDTFVAVCFEKSIWAATAMIAVFKSGGAYVPIDPAHPKGRIGEIMEMANVSVAIVSPSFEETLKDLCNHIIVVHDQPVSFIPKEIDSRSLTVQPANAAYLLFTSGSTGKPKGVVISHSALCTSIIHHGSAYGASPAWRTLQFSAHTFDISVAEIFTTLAFGGCVCIPSDYSRLHDLAGVITDLNVNTALLTSTVASLLNSEEAPSLERIVLAGEPVTKETISRWAGHVNLTNGYGPCETTIYCAGNLNISVDAHPRHIGKSIGATMWIVNPNNHHQLSAIGCVGEIVISGAVLASGYHGDEELTATSFVPAPGWLRELQPTGQYDRLYKSGDLARYNPDGSFYIIGRKDTQVKLRGLRIELGEIEHRIMELGAVTMALALLPLEGPCKNQIVAVVSQSQLDLESNYSKILITSNTPNSVVDRLKLHISYSLPDYMVPNLWINLKTIPLLSSGKIDRKAIRSWVQSMASDTYRVLTKSQKSSENNEIVPGSLADRLRDIWSQVLNVPLEQIDLGSSFFSLGGDSISAIRIVSRAKALGIIITVRKILSSKTLRLLIKSVDTSSVSSPGSFDLLDIPRESNQEFSLSPIQRFFVSANHLSFTTARYHQGFALQLTKDIPLEVLQSAFSALVERHPMLRTIFLASGDVSSQRSQHHTEKAYRYHYHGQVAINAIDAILENNHDGIDIGTGPVFSIDVFEIEKTTHILLTAHHLVIDLVSWRIIIQDVEDYIETGSFSTPVSATFYQWTKFLETSFGNSVETVNYKKLNASSGADIFLGIEPSNNTHSNAQTIGFSLDSEATGAFLEISTQAASAEPVEILISVIANAFGLSFGRSCPTIFVEGHGREPMDSGADLSNTVGWFTIMYPLSNFPNQRASLREYILHVKNGRKSHPDNGLEYFSRALLSDEGNEELKMKPILFNYQGTYAQFENDDSLFHFTDLPELQASLIGPEVKRNSIFEIEAAIRGGEFHFSLSFPNDLEEKSAVSDWVRGIEDSLKHLSARLKTTRSTLLPESISSHLDANDFDVSEQLLATKLAGKKTIQVQDAYPCSPIQREIFKQQATDPTVFILSWEMEFSSPWPRFVQLSQIANAWQRVVQKHPILRTVFLHDHQTTSSPLQVVLSNVEAEVVLLPSRDTLNTDSHSTATSLRESLLPHRIQLFQHDGRSYGRLEINHLLIDGWSLGIIKEDLAAAYTNKDLQPGAPYKSFISSQKEGIVEADRQYWELALHEQPQSLFPLSSVAHKATFASTDKNILSLPTLAIQPITVFCSRHEVTVASVINAAWAQTLSFYTHSPHVSFGYVVSGRDQEVPGGADIVGPMINILAHHLRDISTEDTTDTLAIIAQKIQAQRIQDSEHVFCNIAEISGRGFDAGTLFNTAVNFQRRPDFFEMDGFRIDDLPGSKDPWHFDILVRVVVGQEDWIQPQLEYNTSMVDDVLIQEVAMDFWQRMHKINA